MMAMMISLAVTVSAFLVAPEASYKVEMDCETMSAQIYVSSASEYGIACAFVDVSTNFDYLVDVTFSPTFYLFSNYEVEVCDPCPTYQPFQVMNLGACTLFDGVGADGEWAWLATVEFSGVGNKAKLFPPSDPESWNTFFFGLLDPADPVDYGPRAACQ